MESRTAENHSRKIRKGYTEKRKRQVGKMSDTYREILVKRNTPTVDKVKKAALLGGTAVCAVGGMILWPLLLAAVALGVASYFLIPRFDLEYEYLYVNGELDIDRIMGKQKRKACASYSVENLEIMAPTGSHALDSYQNRREIRVKDFTSLDPTVPSYTLVFNQDKGQEMVKLELDDTVVGDLRRMAPRKVLRD